MRQVFSSHSIHDVMKIDFIQMCLFIPLFPFLIFDLQSMMALVCESYYSRTYLTIRFQRDLKQVFSSLRLPSIAPFFSSRVVLAPKNKKGCFTESMPSFHLCTMVQNSQLTRHLMIHFPTSLGVNKCASEASRGGASELVNGASERANRRAGSPV